MFRNTDADAQEAYQKSQQKIVKKHAEKGKKFFGKKKNAVSVTKFSDDVVVKDGKRQKAETKRE